MIHATGTTHHRLHRVNLAARRMRARWHRRTRAYHRDTRGATTLEWALLLAAIALPSYVIFVMLLETLVAHYRMMVMLNHLPFP